MTTEAEKRKKREEEERRRRNNGWPTPSHDNGASWHTPSTSDYSSPCSDSGSCGGGGCD